MPIMNGCCCFVELRNGSRGSAVFTGVTGALNAAIGIWMLVKMHAMNSYLEPNEKHIWMPPGCLVFLYIELACNLAVIGLSMFLWIGINYGYDGRKMIFGWVWGMSGIRIYEIFLGMYALIWIGGHRVSDVVFVVPEALVVAIYWVLSTVILLAGLLCVVSYWQELINELYGKEKRRRRFYKITNIRHANKYPGTATPSYYGSKRTLAMSSQSLASRSAYPSQTGSSTHPSTSSASMPLKA